MRPDQRHLRACPATSTSRAARPGARLPLRRRPRRTRCPTQIPGNVQPGAVPVQHPARGVSRRRRAIAHLRPRPPRQPTPRSRRTTSKTMSAEHDFTFCATDWSRAWPPRTCPNAVEILQDFSKFPSLADRLQQGILDTLYLGRLLDPPGRALPPTRTSRRRRPLLDTSQPVLRLELAGRDPRRRWPRRWRPTGSARCSAWRRWTTASLLPRSVDFDTYNADPRRPPTRTPDERHRRCCSIAQMLWDRGETDGVGART